MEHEEKSRLKKLGARRRLQDAVSDLSHSALKGFGQPPQAEAKERILRKTIEVIERPLTPVGKTFTTKPLIRRKKTGHRSVRRVAHALVDSWYPEVEVSYEAMELRLKTQFERCSRQTVLDYLGRPETRQVERIDQQIRYRKSGTTTYKDHTFTHRLPAKKGYLEIFGLATLFKDKKGKAWFRIHHQRQSTLDEDSVKSGTPLQRVLEGMNEESCPNKNFLSVIKDSSSEGAYRGDIYNSDREKRESSITKKKNRKGAKVIRDFTLSNVENRSTLPKVFNNNFLVATATRKYDISKKCSKRSKPKLTPEELRILEASQRGNGG